MHRCSCDEDESLKDICPYHVTTAYFELLGDHFGDALTSADARVLLFPDRNGAALSEAAVIEAIRAVALQAGELLVRADGLGKERHRFHEHVLRVTGAQFLARAGPELLLIQLFARWGSAAVLRYLQQAPLNNQQGVACAAIRGLALKDVDRLAPRMMKEFPDMPQGDVRKAVIDSALQVELRDVSDTMLVNYNALDARIMLIEASVAESESTAPSPLLGVRRTGCQSSTRPVSGCMTTLRNAHHCVRVAIRRRPPLHRAAGRQHRPVRCPSLLQMLPRGQVQSRRDTPQDGRKRVIVC